MTWNSLSDTLKVESEETMLNINKLFDLIMICAVILMMVFVAPSVYPFAIGYALTAAWLTGLGLYYWGSRFSLKNYRCDGSDRLQAIGFFLVYGSIILGFLHVGDLGRYKSDVYSFRDPITECFYTIHTDYSFYNELGDNEPECWIVDGVYIDKVPMYDKEPMLDHEFGFVHGLYECWSHNWNPPNSMAMWIVRERQKAIVEAINGGGGIEGFDAVDYDNMFNNWREALRWKWGKRQYDWRGKLDDDFHKRIKREANEARGIYKDDLRELAMENYL